MNSKLIYSLLLLIIVPAALIAADEEELSEEEIKKHLKVFTTEEVDDETCELWTKVGDKIHWHYVGTLLDGSEFDSGVFDATIGAGHVIKGVDYAMRDMCVGEKRRMTIQPEWAYGDRGFPGSIPPNSVLVFNVQLLTIERPSTGQKAEFKDEL